MNYKEKFEQEVRDEVLSWSSDKIYNVFGHYLETIVMNRKWQLQKELKIIWKNRHKYHFRDSGEAFDDYVMCMYFGPKLINRYSNADMEAIINRLKCRVLPCSARNEHCGNTMLPECVGLCVG